MEKVIKEETKKLNLFIFSEKTNKSVAGSLVKNVFLLLIGLILFTATLYADQIAYTSKSSVLKENTLLHPANESVSVNSNGEARVLTTDYEIRQGDIISSENSGNIEIALTGKGVLRMDKNSEISFDLLDNIHKTYEIKLIKGNLWVNTSFDNYTFKVKTDYVYLQPENASFSVSFDGSNTKVYSGSHDVFVGVVYNNEEINSFWLPEGNSVLIPDSKIVEKSETIKKLLYSKLIKEFNYGRLSQDSINNDPWLASQVEKDNKYMTEIKNQYFGSIRETGLKRISTSSIRYQFTSLMSGVENLLTLSSQKKISRFLDVLFENLHDAEYLYLQGNSIDGEIRLSIFKEDINSPKNTVDETFNKDLFARLNEELTKGISINPSDSIYPVKQEIENQLFSVNLIKYLDDSQKFKILALKLNDVSDSAPTDPETSSRILIDYFDLYKQILRGFKDRYQQISRFIERQNILVDNILSKYPKLYKVEIFENKKFMEDDYLASIPGENDKKEQRQTFISSKIDLLSRIKYFLFDDSINAEDARQIVFLLIQDIESLKKDTLDLAAVNTLFEKRLSDFGIFWQYLNSPEYSTTPLHGKTHNERFEAFKEVQKQYVTFQDVRNEILGTSTDVVQRKPTVESILAQAERDLNDADIQDIEFGYYNDATQTKIPILKAVVSGITFRATYDFEKKLVANILVNNKLISQEGVKLENAKKFITQALSSVSTVVQPPVNTEPQTVDPQGTLKNAAKVFIIEKFSKTGMNISKENIEILNFDNGEYDIKNAAYTDNKQATFSFTYKSKEDKIYNLKIDTEAGVKEVSDTFVSAFLKPVVLKIYDENQVKK